MMITEPMTMATDYLLALATSYFWSKFQGKQTSLAKNWSLSFVFLVIAAITGGTAHGFVLVLPTEAIFVIWKLTLIAVGTASYFLLRGTIQWTYEVGSSISVFLTWFNTIQFLIYLILVGFTDSFLLAAVEYGIAFIVVVVIRTVRYLQQPTIEYHYLIRAFGFALLTGLIWILRVGLTRWFNHADLAHITQIGVVYYIHRIITERSQVFENR